MSGRETSLATSRSAPFSESFFLAFVARSSVSAAKATTTWSGRVRPRASPRMSGAGARRISGGPAARLIFALAGEEATKSAGAAAITTASTPSSSARTASRISLARSTRMTLTPAGGSRATGPVKRTTSPPRRAASRASA